MHLRKVFNENQFKLVLFLCSDYSFLIYYQKADTLSLCAPVFYHVFAKKMTLLKLGHLYLLAVLFRLQARRYCQLLIRRLVHYLIFRRLCRQTSQLHF